MANFASGKGITLQRKLDAGDTTLLADIDVGVTNGRLYFVSDITEEWISFSGVSVNGSNFEYTGLVRGLSQVADPATAGTGKTWVAGSTAFLVAMHDQLANTKQDNTFSGVDTFTDIRFQGTTTSGLRVKSLSSAQRNAVSASNGDIVYDIDAGVMYQYIGGSWSTFATGATANASETVSGKVELATATELSAGTSTGSTGARLGISVDNTSTSLTGNKIPVMDGSGNLPQATESLRGGITIASSAEAIAGTATDKALTPARANSLNTYINAGIITTQNNTFTSTITHSLGRIPTEVSLSIRFELNLTSSGEYKDGQSSYIARTTGAPVLGNTAIGYHYEGSGDFFIITVTGITSTQLTLTFTETGTCSGGDNLYYLIKVR